MRSDSQTRQFFQRSRWLIPALLITTLLHHGLFWAQIQWLSYQSAPLHLSDNAPIYQSFVEPQGSYSWSVEGIELQHDASCVWLTYEYRDGTVPVLTERERRGRCGNMSSLTGNRLVEGKRYTLVVTSTGLTSPTEVRLLFQPLCHASSCSSELFWFWMVFTGWLLAVPLVGAIFIVELVTWVRARVRNRSPAKNRP